MVDILRRKPKCKIHISDFDLCVCCGTETEYRKDTPIGERSGYINGVGQLCRKCYFELYKTDSRDIKWEN